nr:DNA helicase [Tanacetum cinerariifolium]
MFAMTSFGAKIDESINNGRGPYVFKVSGQVYHWIGSLCPLPADPPRFLQLYIYDMEHELENMMRHFGGLDNTDLDPEIIQEFKIKLYNADGARGYELPASNTLGVIVFDSGLTGSMEFDVIIEHRGFHTHLNLRRADGSERERCVTMLAYYAYQLHPRVNDYNFIFRGGRRLFRQYLVGVFCCVEQNWLDFMRKKQNDIRSDYLAGLYDAISREDRDGFEVGGKIILPMSFTGGPRYMYAHYLDALAICHELGNPQFFITFTCNAFLSFLKNERIFGTVTGVLYTVEFQKRSLPHCHTLLWVDSASKIQGPEDVDRLISAELPDPQVDPQGYKVVSEMMIHGPCGAVNMSATCMEGDKCSKGFPKKVTEKTFFDDQGHVHYRRRDTGVSALKHQICLDNSNVVPYNRDLLLAFDADINVEYYGWSMVIKYLFKYISKGTDIIFARVSRPLGQPSNATSSSRQPVDEIQNYVEGQFVCPHEAIWRILKFDIHSREPAVQMLSIHLKDMQRITFRDRDRIESVVNLPEFVWYDDRQSWSSRWNTKSSIGRLAYVHPTSGELFYFRMLLCYQKGCRDFLEVQTVHGIFYPTCRAAREALGLLRDNEWDIAMQEACVSATSPQLRSVYAHILSHCEVTDPLKLWRKYWPQMSHDIPGRVLEMANISNYHLNDDSLLGYILYEIEILLNNCGKSLQHFRLGPPPPELLDMLANRLLIEERNYNEKELQQQTAESVPKLNVKQREIYYLIISANAKNQQELIFVYGHEGTGKTFLWKTIISALRSKKNCFSSRIIRQVYSFRWRLSPDATSEERKTCGCQDLTSVDERNLISSFASWLLDIGDGKIGEPDQQDPENTSWIDIPISYCLPDNEEGLSKLIDFIYDENTLTTPSAVTLQHKAIVCPKNETADTINSKVLQMV